MKRDGLPMFSVASQCAADLMRAGTFKNGLEALQHAYASIVGGLPDGWCDRGALVAVPEGLFAEFTRLKFDVMAISSSDDARIVRVLDEMGAKFAHASDVIERVARRHK